MVLNLTAGMGGDMVFGDVENPLPVNAAGTDMPCHRCIFSNFDRFAKTYIKSKPPIEMKEMTPFWKLE